MYAFQKSCLLMQAQRFGRLVSVISLITNDISDYINDVYGHLITQWNQDLLNHGASQRYANAISGHGAPLDKCFGFVDGTARPISRPDKRNNCLYWS